LRYSNIVLKIHIWVILINLIFNNDNSVFKADDTNPYGKKSENGLYVIDTLKKMMNENGLILEWLEMNLLQLSVQILY